METKHSSSYSEPDLSNVFYPSYLVMTAQHNTSAFGRSNEDQLKDFAMPYSKPFHSHAAQIRFVAFIITFLALEATETSNQLGFLLLFNKRERK